MRSDGKPCTPHGVTPELVMALFEQAGPKGLTPRELARELEHRDTPPSKLLKRYVDKGILVKRDGCYILAKFALANKPR